MSYVDELAPHLAFLRRYARALTGSQSSGDAHVRAALEAAIADRSALDSNLPSRVALYKLFHAVWGSSSATSMSPLAMGPMPVCADCRRKAGKPCF